MRTGIMICFVINISLNQDIPIIHLVLVTDLYYSSLHSRDNQLPKQDPDVCAEELNQCFLESVQETFPAVDFSN